MTSSPPTIPLKTWQFWSATRKTLGESYLTKLYKHSTRQLYRWCADPMTSSDTSKNPLDRIEHILGSLVEIGREDIARAAVARMARIISCDLTHCGEVQPDKDHWMEELLDDLPMLADFHGACRGYVSGEAPPETVQHMSDELIREIKETRVKVLNSKR